MVKYLFWNVLTFVWDSGFIWVMKLTVEKSKHLFLVWSVWSKILLLVQLESKKFTEHFRNVNNEKIWIAPYSFLVVHTFENILLKIAFCLILFKYLKKAFCFILYKYFPLLVKCFTSWVLCMLQRRLSGGQKLRDHVWWLARLHGLKI